MAVRSQPAARRREGIHQLAVIAILLFVTVTMGLTYGGNVMERVAAYLDVVEGEVVTAAGIHRDDVLHTRINFKHILGTGFDRVAVADLVVGDAYIERDGSSALDADHANIDYQADGWDWHDGTACTSWTVVTQPWPPPSPITLPTVTCQMVVYQHIDDGDVRPGVLHLADGNTAVLEFVMVGVDPQPGDLGGLTLEYGRADRTELTSGSSVALYVSP